MALAYAKCTGGNIAAIICEPHPSGSLAVVATSERTGLGNV